MVILCHSAEAAETALATLREWSILRKRAGRRGKGRGLDHHRWPNSYFVSIGLFNLEAAQKLELKSLRKAAHF
jgi:RNA-directed DNA polymerase